MKKETDEDALVIEKILGERVRKPETDSDKPSAEGVEKDEHSEKQIDSIVDVKEEDIEFYVKYKNYSYLHCEWKTQAELEKGDRRVFSKIKRYRMKKAQSYFEDDDEELFNPDYVEVDRVLDMMVSKDSETDEEVKHYLVKWRSLSYEEATWELSQDVDLKKVEMFMKFRIPPPEEERKVFARPKPSQWRKLVETIVYKNDNTLREYQLEGVNWLSFCYYNGQNCILADEMGLGKTIQSITFLNEIYSYGIKGPFLVIVPLSTVGNWQREFETWTDMNVVVFHGTSISRNMIKEYELFYKDDKGQRIPDIYRFEALITTFEIILTDFDLLADIEWRCAVIDEAHRLKNKNCRLLEGLRLFDLEHRVLLTGTPLQNNTEELYSLLNFLSPHKFNCSESFIKQYGDLKTEEQVDSLKEILKPMMLRRLKEDVEKNLAPKEETIIEVELTNIQKKYYRAILERNFQFLAKGTNSSVPSLMNTMMELRKCCNHPFLINGAEDKILEEAREKHYDDHEIMVTSMVQSSGKMVLMDKLLPRLKSAGHKVLIFSQMIRVLDIIEDYMMQKKYLYERLDGRIRGTVRQEAIDRFSKPDSDRFAFLLCTRAGGLGINLTAADTVVIYDSDWNPQNDLQAQARCHRIGQSKSVKVYRLITRNSYEREMFDRASLKLGLDKAVLQSMTADKPINPASQLTKKEIEDLLKKGAYGALMEDDNTGDTFCEEDIDQILKRRTKVIQIESEGKGSTFAKASFTMTENRSDIDINDPEFWQKWAKKADIDTETTNKKSELILAEPRQRRQTNRYGNDETALEISDLDTSSGTEDENGSKICKKMRRTRSRTRNADEDFDYANEIPGEKYDRSECFKVEKLLLVYGWGRWCDLLKHAHFKRRLTEDDVLMIARAILAHSLKFYKGDDKIKNFIWDLVSKRQEGELKNHSGLSAPVPRGRKGKKRKENLNFLADQDKPLDFDPEVVLDNGYKRHLHRHSNKVLLRVRLLYYIKQELIGDEADKVFQNLQHTEINIPQPILEGEVPAPWWDEEADKSLIIGVFKYGYEKFNCIRSDPSLCFLTKCGPPDGAALLAEQEDDKDDDDKDDKDDKDEDMTKDDLDDEEYSQSSTAATSVSESKTDDTCVTSDEKTNDEAPTENKVVACDGGAENAEDDSDKLPFPDASSLNVRLRKCITNYQRHHKKRMLKNEQLQRRMERRERTDFNLKEREYKRKEVQQSRWTRREEADFYRTVSTFGVEFSRAAGRFRWDRFREQARLDRKPDEALTEYFHAFYFMCQRVCGKLKPGDIPPNMIFVEPITEERASRCLARIDLLNKIRQDILMHIHLEERVKLCQHSYDMPSWWICGQHDKELLIGAARHGVAKTDFNILRDKTLSFHLVLENSLRSLRGHPAPMTPFQGPSRMDLMTSTPVPRHDRLEQLVRTPASHHLDLKLNLLKMEEIAAEAMALTKPSKVEVKDEPLAESEPGVEDKKDTQNREVKKDGEKVTEKEEKDEHEKENYESQNKIESEETEEEEMDEYKEEKGMSDKDKSEISKDEKDVEKVNEMVKIEKKEETCEELIVQKADKVKDAAKVVSSKPASPENAKIADVSVKSEHEDGDADSDMPKLRPLEMGEDMPPIKARPRLKDELDQVKKELNVLVKLEEAAENEVADVLSEAGKDEKPKAAVVVDMCEEQENEDPRPDYVKLKEKIIKTEIERINEERMRLEREVKKAQNGVSPFVGDAPSLFGDDPSLLEAEGLEPGEIAPTRYFGPAVEWPKDRVIFHRLEHICYTIDHGEWPFARRPPQTFFPPGTPTHMDSRSDTPVAKSDTAAGADSDHSEGGPSLEPPSQGMLGSESDLAHGREFLVHANSERNDGLKMAFPKMSRGRRRKYEIDPDKATRIQQLLNQSASGTLSSDDSQQEALNLPPHSQGHSSPATSTPSHVSHRHLPTSPLVTSPSVLAQSHLMPSPLLNGSGPSPSDMEHVQLQRRMMEQGLFIPDRKRRGRKRRSEKLAEMAVAEALAKREQVRILSMLDPETRIPMINLEDGSVLSGDDCPKKKDLDEWMQQHPGYMIDNSICLLDPYLLEMQASLAAGNMAGAGGSGGPLASLGRTSILPTPANSSTPGRGEDEDANQQVVLHTPEIGPETFVRRRGRKPQLDPRTLNVHQLTGNENVAVVERGTGKKITGSKAPPLKHLKEWLDQNSTFDVEPKWGDLVRTKGVLPKSMDNRILKPSGRGRKPRDPMLHSQMLANEMAFPPSLAALSAFPGAAGLVANFPKLPLGLPFGAMPGLPGLANPLLGLQALGLPGMGFPPHLVKAMEDELKEREKELKEREKEERGSSSKDGRPGGSREEEGAQSRKGDGKEQSSIPTSLTSGSKSSSADPGHPFPFYFNPMLYNPLLAAASGGLPNFSLPASLGGLLAPGLVLPPHTTAPSPVNGQPETSHAESSQSTSSKHHHHHDKKRPQQHPSHEDISRSSPSIPVAHGAEDLTVKRHQPSRSPTSPSSQAQDLSVRRNSEDRPSSSSSSSSSSSARQAQVQATDLSMKPKRQVNERVPLVSPSLPTAAIKHHTVSSATSSSTPSANLRVPGKNKIQGSLKLNRILDSLKDRVLKNDTIKDKKTDPVNQIPEASGKEKLESTELDKLGSSEIQAADLAADVSEDN